MMKAATAIEITKRTRWSQKRKKGTDSMMTCNIVPYVSELMRGIYHRGDSDEDDNDGEENYRRTRKRDDHDDGPRSPQKPSITRNQSNRSYTDRPSHQKHGPPPSQNVSKGGPQSNMYQPYPQHSDSQKQIKPPMPGKMPPTNPSQMQNSTQQPTQPTPYPYPYPDYR